MKTANAAIFLLTWVSWIDLAAAFQTPHHAPLPLSYVPLQAASDAASTSSSSSPTLIKDKDGKQQQQIVVKPSFYKQAEPDRRGRPLWRQRRMLSDLKLGDRLEGYVVQELLDGKTGPKVFLECGVGRYNPKTGTWKLAHAMLRLGNRNAKTSVTQKRMARLRKQTSLVCFVSRIRLGNGALEVVLKEENVDYDRPQKISASSIKAGQELVGKVQRLVPHGAFVDVGANRLGFLHIQKVADLYGKYIKQAQGLKDAGLERGAKMKVLVESNEKKRLLLDFTADVKEEAAQEEIRRQEETEQESQKQQEAEAAKTVVSTPVASTASVAKGTIAEAASSTTSSESPQEDNEDPYAEYAADYSEYSADDYDSYDEERDIEDSLGLGTY